jgi:hypothetical protein
MENLGIFISVPLAVLVRWLGPWVAKLLEACMKRLFFILSLLAFAIACSPKRIGNPSTNSAGNATPDFSASNNGGTGTVEGVISSGGGRGVLCQKDQQHVESLDLYEARKSLGFKLDVNLASQDEAVDFLATTLGAYFWLPESGTLEQSTKVIDDQLTEMIAKIRFTDGKRHLKMVKDSYEVLLDDGCETKQVALYYNETTLMVDKEYWDNMDWTNRAALLAHELVYLKDRQLGATDSINTRKLVAYLFGKQGLRGRGDGLLTAAGTIATCSVKSGSAEVGKMYLFDQEKASKPGVEIVFTGLSKVRSIFRLSSHIDGMSLEQFRKYSDSSKPIAAPMMIETFPQTYTVQFVARTRVKDGGILHLLNSKTGSKPEYVYQCDYRAQEVAVPAAAAAAEPADSQSGSDD